LGISLKNKPPYNSFDEHVASLEAAAELIPSGIGTFIDAECRSGYIGANADARRVIFMDTNQLFIALLYLMATADPEDIIAGIVDIEQQMGLDSSDVGKAKLAFELLAYRYSEEGEVLDALTAALNSTSRRIISSTNSMLWEFSPNNLVRTDLALQNRIINYSNRLHGIDALFKPKPYRYLNFNKFTERDFLFLRLSPFTATNKYYFVKKKQTRRTNLEYKSLRLAVRSGIGIGAIGFYKIGEERNLELEHLIDDYPEFIMTRIPYSAIQNRNDQHMEYVYLSNRHA